MKKLMIAAAIVCVAAMSQASMINWSSKGTTTGGELYATDGATKLYTWASQTGYSITDVILMNAADISQANFLTALRTGKYNDAAFAFGDKALDSQALASTSKINAQKTPELTELKNVGVNVYYAILATDASGNKNVLISTLKGPLTVPSADGASVNASWGTAGTTFSKNNYGAANFSDETGAGWYSVVPEPTSGLLLLLGVAGLALRRRRA